MLEIQTEFTGMLIRRVKRKSLKKDKRSLTLHREDITTTGQETSSQVRMERNYTCLPDQAVMLVNMALKLRTGGPAFSRSILMVRVKGFMQAGFAILSALRSNQ